MNYLAGLNLPFILAYSYSSRKSYVQEANYIYLLVKYLLSAIIYLRNSSIAQLFHKHCFTRHTTRKKNSKR